MNPAAPIGKPRPKPATRIETCDSPPLPSLPNTQARVLPGGGWDGSLFTSAAEGALPLLLHHRTMLVTLDTVRAVFGWDADEVWEQIEGGRLRWVWDISTRPRSGASPAGVRELRFWVCELVAPEFCRALEPAQAVALMLGAQRQSWRACEVAQALMCSRSIVKRLVDAGELAGPLQQHTRWITRPSLTGFLLRRLAG